MYQNLRYLIIMQGTDADEYELTNNDFVHDIEWLLRASTWLLGFCAFTGLHRLHRLHRLRLHGLPAGWGI